MPSWEMRVSAVLSAPRLGFTDHFSCSIEAIAGLGITFQYVAGGFWGQCLETGLEDQIERGADVVITMDYDSLFQRSHVLALLDAIANGADCAMPLMVKRFDKDVLPMESDGGEFLIGHFGLTAFRTEALKRVKKPWFIAEPAPDGSWRAGRVDEDVRFWREWHRTGNSLAVLRNVAVGHLHAMAVWPGPIVQQITDFHANGAPGPWAFRKRPPLETSEGNGEVSAPFVEAPMIEGAEVA